MRAIGLPGDDLGPLVDDTEAAARREGRTRARRVVRRAVAHAFEFRSTSTVSTGSGARCWRRSCARSAGARRSPTASSRRWRAGRARRARSAPRWRSNPLPFVIPCHRVVAAGGTHRRLRRRPQRRRAEALAAGTRGRHRSRDVGRGSCSSGTGSTTSRSRTGRSPRIGVRQAELLARHLRIDAADVVRVESPAPGDGETVERSRYGLCRRRQRSGAIDFGESFTGESIEAFLARVAGTMPQAHCAAGRRDRVIVCTHSDVIDAAAAVGTRALLPTGSGRSRAWCTTRR